MTNTRDLILKLKAVREEKGLSYSDILHQIEENGSYLSKSTISRIFSEGSEDMSFRFEETLKPIANVLLDIDNIEDDDELDVAAMKLLLKVKSQRIDELEHQLFDANNALDREKVKYHEKIDKERAIFDNRIEFLKHQIDLKAERMDKLLEAVFKKDHLYNELLEKTLNCHCCPNAKGE